MQHVKETRLFGKGSNSNYLLYSFSLFRFSKQMVRHLKGYNYKMNAIEV